MSSCVLRLQTITGNPGQEPHSNILGFWTVRTNSKENRLEEKSDSRPAWQWDSWFYIFSPAERLSSKLQTGIRGRQKRSQERPFLLSLEMPHRQSIKFRLVLPPNLFPKQVPGPLVLSCTGCCSLKLRKHSVARNWWRCENQLLPSWRQGQLLDVLTVFKPRVWAERSVLKHRVGAVLVWPFTPSAWRCEHWVTPGPDPTAVLWVWGALQRLWKL